MEAKSSQTRSHFPKWLWTILKLVFSAGILYIILSSSDGSWEDYIHYLGGMVVGWTVCAILFFNISVFFSVWRLQYLFRSRGCNIGFRQNLRLYYIGMFLNLFFPGGIGGDAYKGIRISKDYGVKGKTMLALLFGDRLVGLGGLCGILCLVIMGIRPWYISGELVRWIRLVMPFCLIICLLGTWVVLQRFFRVEWWVYIRVFGLAVMVQCCQLLCIICVLIGMDVEVAWMAYMAIFLVSSVVTVIPITIGGVGLRELCFSSDIFELWYGIDNMIGIVVASIFFIITVISSLVGLVPFVRDEYF